MRPASRPVRRPFGPSVPDGDVPHAGRILQSDVYGWFERVERGVYALSPRGRQALEDDRGISSPSGVALDVD